MTEYTEYMTGLYLGKSRGIFETYGVLLHFNDVGTWWNLWVGSLEGGICGLGLFSSKILGIVSL